MSSYKKPQFGLFFILVLYIGGVAIMQIQGYDTSVVVLLVAVPATFIAIQSLILGLFNFHEDTSSVDALYAVQGVE